MTLAHQEVSNFVRDDMPQHCLDQKVAFAREVEHTVKEGETTELPPGALPITAFGNGVDIIASG